MNHPSKDWLNPKTGNLFKEKTDRATLNHNFRFHSCTDPKDLKDCFIWEYNRTREFIGWKYPKKYEKNIKSVFPFSVNQNKFWKGAFPEEPYLSFEKRVRTRFSSLMGEQYSERHYENLLLPSSYFYKNIPTNYFKIPVELYVDPEWGKTKTVRLFREQWTEIEQKLELNRIELEKDGHNVDREIDNKETQANSYKTKLKILGHIRLLHCVGLDFYKMCEIYGSDAYQEKAIFMKEVRKFQQLDGLMKKIIKHFGR